MRHFSYVNASCLALRHVFCKRALLKRLYSAKEAYISREPTNHIFTCEHFMSHVSRMSWRIHIWDLTHGNLWSHVLFRMWMRHVSHMWVRHVSRVNMSCLTCKCVVSHVWIRHVSRGSAACLTCERVMSLTCERVVLSLTCECVMSLRLARVSASCLSYESVIQGGEDP